MYMYRGRYEMTKYEYMGGGGETKKKKNIGFVLT